MGGRVGHHSMAAAALAAVLAFAPAGPLAAEGQGLGSFERAAELSPQDPQAQFNLGIMCLKARSYEKAARALKKAVALAPKDAEAWEALGTALLELKQAAPAAEALRQATGLDSKRAGAWQKLGTALDLAGRPEDLGKAAEAFAKAGALRPDDPLCPLNQGLVLARMGQDSKATAALAKASRMPGGERAFGALCVLYNKAGQWDKAVAACRRAAEAGGKAESWYNLGFALQREDKDGEARKAYAKAVAADAGHAPSLYALAFLDFEAGDADKALRGFEAALKARGGDYPEAEYNAAVLLADQGRYEEAAQLYRTLLKRDPGNQDAGANLKGVVAAGSAALLEQGKDAYERGAFDAARQAWERAHRLDPDNAEVGRLLKRARAKVSASAAAAAAAARKSAQAAVERRLKAEDERVRERGVEAYRQGKDSEAVRLLDFYLAKNPGDAGIQTMLIKARGRMRAAVDGLLQSGRDALASGDRVKASTLAGKALDLDPGDARALALQKEAGRAPEKRVDQDAVRKLYYDGVEQYLAGDLASAVATWKKVLQQAPDNLDAKRSLDRAELELEALRQRGKG